MNILGIDTATMTGSVAVITEQQLIAETTVNTKTTHTERLLPMIDQTLRAASLTIQQIDAIAVASGAGVVYRTANRGDNSEKPGL